MFLERIELLNRDVERYKYKFYTSISLKYEIFKELEINYFNNYNYKDFNFFTNYYLVNLFSSYSNHKLSMTRNAWNHVKTNDINQNNINNNIN